MVVLLLFFVNSISLVEFFLPSWRYYFRHTKISIKQTNTQSQIKLILWSTIISLVWSLGELKPPCHRIRSTLYFCWKVVLIVRKHLNWNHLVSRHFFLLSNKVVLNCPRRWFQLSDKANVVRQLRPLFSKKIGWT